MTRISIVTGATRNLGFSLAQGLARRLDEDDVVYLTGRDSGRVDQSMRLLSGHRANVRGEVLDVSDREAVERFAGAIADRHGGVDIVFSNHYAVDRAVCAWRDIVRQGLAAGQAWPEWINIPSKIGQVAAVRVLAQQRRAEDLRRGILIAAISPGLIDTGASRQWLDMTGAPPPDEVAIPLLDLALEAASDAAFYGGLINLGRGEPGRFRTLVPWI